MVSVRTMIALCQHIPVTAPCPIRGLPLTVIDDSSLLVGHAGESHLVDLELGDVEHDNGLEELRALLAEDAQLAHVRHVEQRRRLRGTRRETRRE